MRIVEALILAPGQDQDQLLLGNRNRPRHGASTIAMLHPAQGIGLIAAFQPLHLTLAQMQQAGGLADAPPPPPPRRGRGFGGVFPPAPPAPRKRGGGGALPLPPPPPPPHFQSPSPVGTLS